MLIIAKLSVRLKDANIKYNSSLELETTKERGTVLADGKIVRGLGTHFESKEAKDRFDRLTSRSNAIREEFNRKFARGPFEGTYVMSKAGEALEFASQFANERPDIDVVTYEVNLSGAFDMAEWQERIKSQAKRVGLGRAEFAADDGLNDLANLAQCPVLATSTRDSLLALIAQARAGDMKRVDFKRNIDLLKVEMDTAPLMVPRAEPSLK